MTQKFEPGESVIANLSSVVTRITPNGRVRVKLNESGYLVDCDTTRLERYTERRRITSVDQIREGATYDLAGAKLSADRHQTLNPAGGGDVGRIPRSIVWILLKAGAVITEVAPPPEPEYVEPEWQPGDWAEDECGEQYVFGPQSAGDSTPWFRALVGERRWFGRDEIKTKDGKRVSKLTLTYRHGVTS